MNDSQVDCLVVGGGPAGLTAAIYLARFLLRTLVVDAGDGRAITIPCTRNHAGHPGGISGAELVSRMRTQAVENGARIVAGRVKRLIRQHDGFIVHSAAARWHARTVLLATGTSNVRPAMPATMHDAALARGLIRYCPICDGHEVIDKRVAVLGTGAHGVREALFLRSYTADLTLVAPGGPHLLGDGDRDRLRREGVDMMDGPVRSHAIVGDMLVLETMEGAYAFDSLYPALGSVNRSELARQLGAALAEDGCVTADRHQRTSVPGLYAAGDVVLGLDQISHAMGQAGVAATSMRNDLNARDFLRRAAAQALSAAAPQPARA